MHRSSASGLAPLNLADATVASLGMLAEVFHLLAHVPTWVSMARVGPGHSQEPLLSPTWMQPLSSHVSGGGGLIPENSNLISFWSASERAGTQPERGLP